MSARRLSLTYPRSRRARWCDACRGEIDAGEVYRRESCVHPDADGPYSLSAHVHCAIAVIAGEPYDDPWGEGVQYADAYDDACETLDAAALVIAVLACTMAVAVYRW